MLGKKEQIDGIVTETIINPISLLTNNFKPYIFTKHHSAKIEITTPTGTFRKKIPLSNIMKQGFNTGCQ